MTAPPVGDVLTYEQKVITVRRISAALGAFALLVSLAACGDSDAAGELDAVNVSGEFGAAPEVTWNDQVTADKLAVTTLIEGTGDSLAKGDTVKVNLWIGNGYTKELAYSTWDPEEGEKEPRGAQALVLNDQTIKGIVDGVVGHTVGSRVLVIAPPADAFGDSGNTALGIGDGDSVVFVIDIESKVVTLDGPQGTPQTPPAGTPKLVEKGGKPTGFDFTGLPEAAPTKFSKAVLIKGDGEVVEKGQTITVNYLGSLWGSTTPFDQSYTGAPYTKPIGVGNFIKGWDNGLVGLTVGSRVVLTIPPGLAYGESGSGDTIPPNSTLVFVVDILSAS